MSTRPSRRASTPGEIIEPVAAWIEQYRQARERYVTLYPALHGIP